jgi:glycosyltransferase involved in cell wall biosynthesis
LPRIAVIIPTYNDGDLVGAAVASVREQEPVEIVVVDDGSEDAASRRALDELRGAGTRVLRQANSGPAAARNAGLGATTAPFAFFLDADDLVEPGALGRLADLLDARSDLAVAWGDYLEFGALERRGELPPALLPWSTTYVNLYAPSCLLRRCALERIGGWPLIGYEDWGLFVALVGSGARGAHAGGVVYRRRTQAAPRRLTGLRADHRRLYRELPHTFPDVFSARRRLARAERPPAWKRLVYPLLFGPRLLLPAALEDVLRRSRAWSRVRRLRR